MFDQVTPQIEFQALLSASEWADPATLRFRDILWRMSDEEFEALEDDLMAWEETGEKSPCISWLEGFFQRCGGLALAA
ncbi:MAG: hypothetical protein AAF871_13025 [Pseudomonadota bacterium]